jgi:hypothetical protein
LADAARKEPVAPVSVRELPDRGRVLCHGFIESVTYAPASKVASFVAILVDHEGALPGPQAAAAVQRQGAGRPQGRLRVIWLGRRRIPGIDAGTELKLEGMVTFRDRLPTMFNPRYEILSRQEEQ